MARRVQNTWSGTQREASLWQRTSKIERYLITRDPTGHALELSDLAIRPSAAVVSQRGTPSWNPKSPACERFLVVAGVRFIPREDDVVTDDGRLDDTQPSRATPGAAREGSCDRDLRRAAVARPAGASRLHSAGYVTSRHAVSCPMGTWQGGNTRPAKYPWRLDISLLRRANGSTNEAEDQRTHLPGLQRNGLPCGEAAGATGPQNLSGQMQVLRR